jgi:hypothetical protein
VLAHLVRTHSAKRTMAMLAIGWLNGVCAVLLAAHVASAAQHAAKADVAPLDADGWSTLRHEGFRVSLPGIPEDERVALGERAVRRTRARTTDGVYAVFEAVSDDAPEPRRGAKVTKELHAVEITDDDQPLRVESRTLVLGARRVVLVVSAPAATFSAERASRFFGSFERTD